MTTTEWHLTVTTFAGELFAEQNGCGVTRASAITELFESARDHVVDRGPDTLPVYTLRLDGQMVGFVATGHTPGDHAPDIAGARAQLAIVETAVQARFRPADMIRF